jgi:Protein of unknown function (DUF2909)
MKVLILLTLAAIVASLGRALFAMSAGPTSSKAMVNALTVRIALSVALFVLLMIGWYTHLIVPHALQ